MIQGSSTASHSGRVSGDFSALTIFDLTQLMMLSQKSALLTISCRGRKGYVYFDNGQIVSVTDDSLFQGTAAAFRVFLWQGGTFDLDFSKQTSERNIRIPTESLMLDIARQLDEASMGNEENEGAATIRPWSKPEKPEEDGEESLDTLRKERLRQINNTFGEIANRVLGSQGNETAPVLTRLLDRTLESRGDALFLTPGGEPQIRVEGRVILLPDEPPLTPPHWDEILGNILNAQERGLVAEQKEIRVVTQPIAGQAYRALVSSTAHGPVLSFHPLPDAMKAIAEASIPRDFLEGIERETNSLVVVAGQNSETVDRLIAGIVGHLATSSGNLGALLLRHSDFTLAPAKGLVLLRRVKESQEYVLRTLRRAQLQHPRYLGLTTLNEPRLFQEALTITRSHPVTMVCSLVSAGIDESMTRLRGQDDRSIGTGLPSLSESLDAFIQLGASSSTNGASMPTVESILTGDEVRNQLRATV